MLFMILSRKDICLLTEHVSYVSIHALKAFFVFFGLLGANLILAECNAIVVNQKLSSFQLIAPCPALPISGLQQQHQEDLEKLRLTTQPFKTLKLFILAITQSLKGWASYVTTKGGLLMLLSVGATVLATWLSVIDVSYEKVVYFPCERNSVLCDEIIVIQLIFIIGQI